MLVKLDETLTCPAGTFALATNRWIGGAVSPEGYKNIQSFALEGSVPLWTFACADVLLEKRIWMQSGANTTFIEYTLVSAPAPVTLIISGIADNRIFHNAGECAWPATVTPLPDGVRIEPPAGGGLPLTLRSSAGTVAPASELYSGFYLPEEAERGLRSDDNHVHVVTFTVVLAPGATVQVLGSAETSTAFDPSALATRHTTDQALLTAWQNARIAGAPPPPDWVRQLVLAADQFVVDRTSSGQPAGKSVIAGYHWFDDWGRDTMISLPGLTLVTGRAPVAATILRTFARFVSQGMLPNRFPNIGQTPEYNTIDATLWYFQAIRAYFQATADTSILTDLFPVLSSIIDSHVQGTRYGIKVDQADGLLRGGQPGVQLTWMDAIVNGNVITPRIGKPVEINALWYSALIAMSNFAKVLGKSSTTYDLLAAKALSGFDRFWNPATNFCFDVLDGPNGNEDHLRPNQLFAISLTESPLTPARQRMVIEACSRTLLTSYGLRSLSPSDPQYRGIYQGPQTSRDAAYHQGTVWGWLIGPFIAAHLRVFQSAPDALRILEAVADHLHAAGLGTISEILDGDAPFEPKGCIAQAWSVAEYLRSFDQIERFAAAQQAKRRNV
jgi:predicted glycogen debranching enzyme